MSSIDVRKEALYLRKLVNDIDIKISSYPYQTTSETGVRVTYVGHDYKNEFISALNELTKAEANKGTEASLTEISTRIVTIYTKLAGNGNVSETPNFRSTNEKLREELDKEISEKDTLKKDNEKLVEQYFTMKGKFELISEKYDKLIEGLKVQAAKSG